MDLQHIIDLSTRPADLFVQFGEPAAGGIRPDHINEWHGE